MSIPIYKPPFLLLFLLFLLFNFFLSFSISNTKTIARLGLRAPLPFLILPDRYKQNTLDLTEYERAGGGIGKRHTEEASNLNF